MTAVVLAGGRSSRMGKDKTLLPVEGVSLLERTISLVKPFTQDTVVVTNTPQAHVFPGIRLMVDEQPFEGPLAAFAVALHTIAPSETVLLLACDMPNLSSPLIRALLEKSVTAGEKAVVAKTSRGWEPLCACYPGMVRIQVERVLAEGGRSMQELLNRIEKVEVVWKDEELESVNTPEDYGRQITGV